MSETTMEDAKAPIADFVSSLLDNIQKLPEPQRGHAMKRFARMAARILYEGGYQPTNPK